ncbi:hypothetical protein K432DRAFT_439995 [Lepidopterella palustris CBS 459.81]|uniref:F-box domain-containing protein n=1 Tax=Lepidopterella palustris CBS 459.81 TaxID=1314670 RepID=A0A8E2EIB9_9PEZI|nr:hypothetical protein K432DRAFT_439995 [Lepidopterella palustris CBS 459.81]
MTSRLGDLPIELFLNITSFLRHEDLSVLVRVSKAVHRVIQPLIWTNIELHPPEYHEKYDYLEARLEMGSTYRAYHAKRPGEEWQDAFDYEQKSRSFVELCEYLLQSNPARLTELTTQVRSLCLVVDTYADEEPTRSCWNIFARFTNLESLEITGKWSWYNEFVAFDGTASPLTKLRVARIYGYVPREFIQYVLCSGSSLTKLEIGTLDAPISSSRFGDDRLNSPPGYSDPYESDSDDEAVPFGFRAEDLALESDEEDLDENEVAPRPLIWVPDSLDQCQFLSLTSLWLCKPSEAHIGHGNWHYYTPTHSVRSDRRSLVDWVRLVRAVIPTLVNLTFEHRLVGPEIESESTTSKEFIEIYGYGPGDERFKELVLPMLEEEVSWPALKRLAFYGILVGKKAPQGVKEKVTNHFSSLGVDVQFYLGKRMLFVPEEGTVCISADGMGSSSDSSGDV